MDLLVNKYINHFQSLLDIEINLFDVRLKRFMDAEKLFCEICPQKCNFDNTHLYGCFEAQRWDNKYIYYCPMGFIFIAITVINAIDIIDYAVISGPVIMGNADEFSQDINIKDFSTARVNDISEIMSAVFGKISELKNKQEFATTDVILNDIYKLIDVPESVYPIELEKELQKAIIDVDKELSKSLLNQLLGHIFFSTGGDFKVIKSRVLELIVMLSRSAIEGGADIEQIFALNSNYIKEVENFTTLEKLSVWLTGIINRFISYVFEFNDVKHTDIIYKVTGYVKANYKEKISLDDIARHVYLSKSYLSKIFKDDMKCNLSTYINQIRIEKSKAFLLDKSINLVDIANGVGFDDQSYFTKVFKSIVGISPGKFREKHGKV